MVTPSLKSTSDCPLPPASRRRYQHGPPGRPLALILPSSLLSTMRRAWLKAHRVYLLMTKEHMPETYQWEGKKNMCRGPVNARGLPSMRPGSLGDCWHHSARGAGRGKGTTLFPASAPSPTPSTHAEDMKVSPVHVGDTILR